MAGESPDKSEQRKSSGETTGRAGSERDPRLGVARESRTATDAPDTTDTPDAPDTASAAAEKAGNGDGGSNGNGNGNDGATDGKGNARLKAAVAAWVAGEEDEASSPSAGEARPKADAEAKPEPEAKAKAEAKGEPEAKPGPRTDAAAETAGEKPAGDKPAADRATAVFRTVRPKDEAKGDEDEAGDEKPAAGRPAPDKATAVFRTVRPKADASGTSDAEKKQPQADRATAVFRTVTPKGDNAPDAKPETKPAATAGPKAEPKSEPKAEPKAAPKAEVEAGSEPAARKPAADQPTAVFRAVRPADAKAEAKTGSKADPKADPGADSKTAPKGDSGDQPTELLKAPKPEPEGKSRFVPLKKDDAPAKPAAKPAAKAAAPKAPAPKAPASAPAAPPAPPKPAIPVSVPPKAPAPAGGPAAGSQGPQGPQAPLDLLAQLTNTPPPPETPVRSALRRVKIWTPLVALLAVVFVVVQAFRPLPAPKLALGAHKSFTFAGDKPDMAWPSQGQSAAKVLGAGDVGTSGEQKPVPTASVAKVMTAWVILKDHPLKPGEKGPMITIDAQAARESQAKDESRLVVSENQQFSEYDMLQMLLIPSGNNIARQLARWDAKSEEEFVAKMNAAAKDLGMTNTTYTDPSGLKETTRSTAVDQVKLAEVAIQNKVVREITGKTNTDIPGLSERIYNNNDKLLVKQTGVLGIKTGSSGPAGGALMWAVKKTIDGKEQLIVGATMDQRNPNSNDANAHLAVALDTSYKQTRAIQDALTKTTVVKKGDVVGYVDDGLGGRTPLVVTKDVEAVGWAGFTTKFALADGGRKLPHTAKAGTEVGELTVGTGAGQVRVPVALQKDLAEPSFGAKLTRIS
ncbi:D-alanyl-D-alanine carboxypeptidase [Streptomyces mashuensis]|uniref:D-alanyl-D-alanine carboxypeptidase n=1 Tax=Streptomyces mashuensis TaxID=33904 RepID=A0A919B721_9ACTN|nr:D-alanyl-D-alanine carboxypeptidase [Streptomyces mashuensis]GHF58163.1 D-alanyl-D-alanine carboxypeptidase [Streptomyces mashuensis]